MGRDVGPMTDCTYCGCPVEAHDPVSVTEGGRGTGGDAYCNYGCLGAHIDEAGLAVGTSCALVEKAE